MLNTCLVIGDKSCPTDLGHETYSAVTLINARFGKILVEIMR